MRILTDFTGVTSYGFATSTLHTHKPTCWSWLIPSIVYRWGVFKDIWLSNPFKPKPYADIFFSPFFTFLGRTATTYNHQNNKVTAKAILKGARDFLWPFEKQYHKAAADGIGLVEVMELPWASRWCGWSPSWDAQTPFCWGQAGICLVRSWRINEKR